MGINKKRRNKGKRQTISWESVTEMKPKKGQLV
jgi:hypothetical protein